MRKQKTFWDHLGAFLSLLSTSLLIIIFIVLIAFVYEISNEPGNRKYQLLSIAIVSGMILLMKLKSYFFKQ